MSTTKNKDSERNLYSGAVQLIGGKGYNMLNLISAQSVLPLITCLKTLAVWAIACKSNYIRRVLTCPYMNTGQVQLNKQDKHWPVSNIQLQGSLWTFQQASWLSSLVTYAMLTLTSKSKPSGLSLLCFLLRAKSTGFCSIDNFIVPVWSWGTLPE